MKHKKSLHKISTHSCIATLLMSSIASHANVLEEVIVTAQKRAESLQDVPIAVSAFSGEDIINQGIGGTQALQASTPGLVFNTTGAAAQPFLRGVGTRLAQNGLELSIATYIDDRYIARATSTLFELADVERIEVLKGPQGTLYGRNSTGGAIRVITKAVDDEFNGTLKASYGDYNAYMVSASVNVPVSDNFGMRITGMSKGRDGYAENVNPAGRKDWDDLDFQAFRTKFRWDMSDTATANLTLDYWQRDDLSGVENIDVSPVASTNNVIGAALPQTTEKGFLASAINDSNDGSEFSGQLRFDVDFDGFNFASITTFSDFELNWLGDADGGSLKHLDAFVIDESTGFSQEIQFLSKEDSAINWIAGAYFFDDSHDYELWADISEVAPGLGSFSQSDQSVDSSSWAVFAQVGWALTDNTNLTIGGRYTQDEKEVVGVASSLPFVGSGALGAVVPVSLEDDWGEFTPKVTIDTRIGDNTMVYLTYARGFKSGGFNYPAVTSQPPEESALEPETLDMIELGMKGEFLDSSLRLNGSLYYYDYKDLQVTRAAGEGAGAAVTTENAADATITGLDLDMTWLASDNLTIVAGLNILDTEYKDYVATAKVFGATPSGIGTGNVGYVADGEDLIRAPGWSGFVSAEYVVQMNGGTLPIYLSYSRKDDYLFDFVTTPEVEALRQEAYGLLTARISYQPDNGAWNVGIYGGNLTDEDYNDDSVANGAGVRINRGAPRTYGVDFTYNF